MRFLFALPACLLFSAVHARIERRQTSNQCLASQNPAEKATIARADIYICYIGESSATKPGDTTTNKSPAKFSLINDFKCPDGTKGACFWMNGPNTWKGYGKGDPNSIMTWHYDINACSYDDAHITVTCKP